MTLGREEMEILSEEEALHRLEAYAVACELSISAIVAWLLMNHPFSGV